MRKSLQPSTIDEVKDMLRLAYENDIPVKFLDYIENASSRNLLVGSNAIEIWNDWSIDQIAEECRKKLKRKEINVHQPHIDELKIHMSNLAYVPSF